MAYNEESFTPEEVEQARILDEQIERALHASSFPPANQHEASEAQFIGELQRSFQPQAQGVDQRLERVWGRLEQRSVSARQQNQPKRSASSRSDRPQGRGEQVRNPLAVFRKTPSSWPSHIGALVAVALLVVLIGGLTLGLILVHHGGNVTGGQATPTVTLTPSTPTPTPTSGPAHPVTLSSLRMLDEMNGWALTNSQVLRTTDGGNHWQDVTPPSLRGQLQSDGLVSTDFLTPLQAWVVISPGPTSVFATTNGGQTWHIAQVQTVLAFEITFINAQDGWLASSPNGTAAGSQDLAIFRTTDGGTTWTKVESTEPNNSTPGALPFVGDKSGISFLDANTGWATGTETVENFSWLYVTHDGGATWQHQTLSLPPGVTQTQLSLRPPTFFGSGRGILPVGYVTGNGPSLDVYVTTDNGSTWQSPTPVVASLAYFLDANQGWATDGSALFVTSDGGLSWTKLPASNVFKNVSSLDFVSNTVGWAISDLDAGGTQLLKTTDGGQIWTPVTPTV